MQLETLIKKAKMGNHHAFRLIVEMYKNDVFRIVYSILRNQKDAEDAAQEVFIKIYTSLPNYGNQGFKTWVSRIAVNHAIDMKRKYGRSKEDSAEQIYESRSTQLTTEQQILQKEEKIRIYEKLNELPANYREVIIGYYIKEKTTEELASEQNVKVKTIETKLYRARVWMRKHWKEEDFL